MERLRDSYRGRYRDRHNNNSTSRNNYDERSTRGNYRGHSTHDNDNNNSNYSSRNSPNNGYNYRSSRNSLNSRPILSRNGPSTHYRHHRNNEDDDYPHSSHPPTSSSSSNRINNGHNSQSNYYDNRSSSSSSRYDRSSNHREIYPSLLDDQPILSKGPPSYYSNSQPLPLLRDRPLQLPPSQYNDIDQNRYLPSSSSSNYRRDNSPPFISSHRNERSMDYIPRNINNDIYMRGNYRPPTSPSLTSLSARVDPYGDTYRTNEYNTRSERYDIPLNRNNTSSRDYPMASSTYRNDLYRSSSNASMQSSSSTYMVREQYPLDINYRPVSQSRDYENVSMSSRTSSMDHRDGVPRNSRDRNHNDYHSSYQDRPNLKRSGSRYNDNGPIPSKRSMRR